MLFPILSFSQKQNYYLDDLKLFTIKIINLNNIEKATEITKSLEKEMLSEMAWLDINSKICYCIIHKNKNIAEIETYIKTFNGLNCSNTKEIILTDDLFLQIYSQKSGVKPVNFEKQLPNYITFNDNNQSEIYYHTAKEIWINKFPESYNALYSEKTVREIKEVNNLELPADFPKFIDTGNPKSDNYNYQKAKENWILENPEKYKIIINYGKTTDSENQEKISKEQKINNHEN